jgi:hypothetical protein
MTIPTPAEREALKASAAQCGHTFAKIESALPGFLARLAERELKKAYGKPPVWLPLTRRTDPTIGRKRRARRARGRWIEARQTMGHGHWFRVQLDSASGFRSKSIGPTTRIFNVDIPTCIDELNSFLDPSLGEPWEGQGDG